MGLIAIALLAGLVTYLVKYSHQVPKTPRTDKSTETQQRRIPTKDFDSPENPETEIKTASTLESKIEAHDTMPDPITGMEFISIPGGCFLMGSPDNEQGRDHREGPRHEVCVDGFQMGKYEVTQGQWVKIMGGNPSQYQKGDEYPVEKVSWNKIQEFITELNKQSGREYRLPTEAEWEYAARAGTSTARYWGGDISCDRAMYGNDKYQEQVSCMDYIRSEEALTPYSSAPVGSYPPNRFGLYDMLGNVSEFCSNWLGDYPSAQLHNPQGPAKGDIRVFRGGALGSSESGVRAAVRWGLPLHERDYGIGFRLVLSVQQDQKIEKIPETVIDPNPVSMTDPVTGMEFVSIPKGCFQMGSPDNEKSHDREGPRHGRESPRHKVCVDGFQMGKYEVTQGQWLKIMVSNPSQYQKGDEYPVEKMTWNKIQKFLTDLNKQSGKEYRLPTEAEWEYAARAGTSTSRHWGDDISCDKAMYANSKDQDDSCMDFVRSRIELIPYSTAPVGSYPANQFGLHDMLGNVWEFCSDWLGDYPSSLLKNPQGPPDGKYRVYRGGSWVNSARKIRSAVRYGRPPYHVRDRSIGFRLVLSGL